MRQCAANGLCHDGHCSACPPLPADCLPLLHPPAEGEGAAAALLHAGRRPQAPWGSGEGWPCASWHPWGLRAQAAEFLLCDLQGAPAPPLSLSFPFPFPSAAVARTVWPFRAARLRGYTLHSRFPGWLGFLADGHGVTGSGKISTPHPFPSGRMESLKKGASF